MDLKEIRDKLADLDSRILNFRKEEIAIQAEVDTITLQLARDASGVFRRDAEWRLKAQSSRMYKLRLLDNLYLSRKGLVLERYRIVTTSYWQRFIEAAHEMLPRAEFMSLHEKASVDL